MDIASVFSTLASVAASLVGFSGLLTAFRASNEVLTPYDSNNIRSLLIYSVSALLFALLPLPFWIAKADQRLLWAALTAILGLNLLFWSLQSPRWMKRKKLRPRLPWLYRGVIATQAVVGVVLLTAGLGWVNGAALYAGGVLWLLLVSIVVFVVQIFRLLPIEESGADG